MGVDLKSSEYVLRESQALHIMQRLVRRGAEVTYTDPYIPEFSHAHLSLKSIPEASVSADCAVIVTDHKVFDYPGVMKRFPLVVDTRNALKGISDPRIVRL